MLGRELRRPLRRLNLPYREFRQGRTPTGARVATALYRMEMGNLSNARGVGGVLEYRIDFGPGYRIYFGRGGDVLIILLGGGTKARQQRDIEAAVGCGASTGGTSARRVENHAIDA